MEKQDQVQQMNEDAIVETQNPEEQKTVRDELASLISAELYDRDLALKLIATSEDYLSQNPDYSLADFTEVLWQNYEDYIDYLEQNDRVSEIAQLSPIIHASLMPKIVQLLENDQLQAKIAEINQNANL